MTSSTSTSGFRWGWALVLCCALAAPSTVGCSRESDNEHRAPSASPLPAAVPTRQSETTGTKLDTPVAPTAVAVAQAVQRHLGLVKKCWKKTDARFTGETQTLRFVIGKGTASVSFVEPQDNANALGVCIREKLSHMTFAVGPPITLDVPVRFSERRPTSSAPASAPASSPAIPPDAKGGG